MCNGSRTLFSPLHAAVSVQLLGCINPERAAPAIFLLAHAAFDAQALHVAALIYEKAGSTGERLAGCLMQEALLRAKRADPYPKSATSKVGSQSQIENLVGVLTEVSERIGLCARIDGGLFNEGVRAAQKEVEAAILRLPKDPPSVIA